ncbi:unnamed protein product [Blepharisma stoltei]|uniref:Uncharacterized protein n=1 Tax=Blepharisma stoltei TaxID=1481888 RepID=A0AAU9IRR4_9CILI|nr:unnamed protein product [Blepharisma stoltei]
MEFKYKDQQTPLWQFWRLPIDPLIPKSRHDSKIFPLRLACMNAHYDTSQGFMDFSSQTIEKSEFDSIANKIKQRIQCGKITYDALKYLFIVWTAFLLVSLISAIIYLDFLALGVDVAWIAVMLTVTRLMGHCFIKRLQKIKNSVEPDVALLNEKIGQRNLSFIIGNHCYWIEIKIIHYAPPVIPISDLESLPPALAAFETNPPSRNVQL